ncbi:MAG: GGDEF domain-containing protein, partial [Pseudomonadota bacterium]
EVAQRLIQETREHDTVVRAGGDEFLLILPLLTADEPLVKLAERVIARLEKPIPYEGNDCNISASAGITVSEWYDAPDVDTMLGDADASLYASKREGRGRVTLCRPGDHDAES